MNDDWQLRGSCKDRQSITADWEFASQTRIVGVSLKEVRNVPKANGFLTEVYRRDWALDDKPVDQVFQVVLTPGGVSAWHTHAHTTDRLFVNQGMVRIVLYDPRPDSATYRTINELKLGIVRPGLLIVPPRVWHGVQNIAKDTSSLLNLVDRAYQYDDPDHWRLPPDCPEIPYKFEPSS